MNPKYDLIPEYELIPEHMREGVRLYIEMGLTPGSFLFFLLADEKWTDVLSMADDINKQSIYKWRMFFNTIPMGCWGSRESVQRWMEVGGLNGLQEKQCQEATVTQG